MSAKGFKQVFMAGVVGGAALSCYLVSLSVASTRAELESVEGQILMAQRDIRTLETEVGTRGRLAQLERWNANFIRLSAPKAEQFVEGGFQLATLARPERKAPDAVPVVMARPPAAVRERPAPNGHAGAAAPRRPSLAPSDMIHTASLKTAPVRETAPAAKPLPAPAKTSEAGKKAPPRTAARPRSAGRSPPSSSTAGCPRR